VYPLLTKESGEGVSPFEDMVFQAIEEAQSQRQDAIQVFQFLSMPSVAWLPNRNPV